MCKTLTSPSILHVLVPDPEEATFRFLRGFIATAPLPWFQREVNKVDGKSVSFPRAHRKWPLFLHEPRHVQSQPSVFRERISRIKLTLLHPRGCLINAQINREYLLLTRVCQSTTLGEVLYIFTGTKISQEIITRDCKSVNSSNMNFFLLIPDLETIGVEGVYKVTGNARGNSMAQLHALPCFFPGL